MYVAGAVFVGASLALVSHWLFGRAPNVAMDVEQGIGAAVLLWATLFVRGWDIQSMGAPTLPEQVNQWLYRGLAVLGTVLAVWGTVWAMLS